MKQHSPLSSPVLVICILALITDCRSEVARQPEQKSVAEGSPAGGSYEDWLRWCVELKQETSLIRHYAFDDMVGNSVTSSDLAGKGGAMSFGVVPKQGVPRDKLALNQGRWKGCKAVQLDQGFLASEPFDVKGRTFTVEAWVRPHGIGAHRGNSGATNGTLLSTGIGYWDGWRLTLTYPAKTIGFEIGRSKPSHSVGIRTRQAISDGVWSHLAASWDGQEMRIYVNGMLAARGEYSGDYTPPAADGRFKIGYAGYGWGSVKMDVDEVIAFERALSPGQIFQHAHFYVPVADPFLAQLQLAEIASLEGDTAKAASALKAALRQPDLHPDLQAVLRLRLSDLDTQKGNPSGAAKRLVPALQLPGLAERYRVALLDRLLHLALNGAGDAIPAEVHAEFLRMTADSPRERLRVRLNIARSFRAAKQYDFARQHLQTIADSPNIPKADRMNVRLELGHTCLEGKAPQAARIEYAKVASAEDAPGHLRAYAQWLIAECLSLEKNDDEARSVLERLAGMAEAPEHFRAKARQRLARERAQETEPAGLARLRILNQPKLRLYVAPDGSDENPGTLKRPFQTLERARRAVSALKQKSRLDNGASIIMRGGEYPIRQTFHLSAEDSGSPDAPVFYRAYPGERPRLTGGTRLTGFRPVSDAGTTDRLPGPAKNRIFVLDLKSRGISDWGKILSRGFGQLPQPSAGLYFNGKAMHLARWPNEGFTQSGKLVDKGDASGNRGPAFEYRNDRTKRWSKALEPWAFGYWYHDWADGAYSIGSIDSRRGLVRFARPIAKYGIRNRRRFHFFNLLEELDVPGEYYLERSAGKLYLYPPSNPAEADIRLSMFEEPMAVLDDVSHVVFEGLTFETSRGEGMIINGGSGCLLKDCTLRQFGLNGVTINGGKGHGIFGCNIHTMGRGGTRIHGGDRKTLTPGGHFVESCHFHDLSRVNRTYAPAVWLDGAGNRIAHNLMHDIPSSAMRVEGNDHVIEFNEIHHVVYESDDQGGLDMWFNPSYRGNVIRYNYWHHIGSGEKLMGQAGIRLDDAISGTLVYGNVFYKCSNNRFGAVQIHGGKENIIDNNIFIECKYAVSFSSWGPGRWKSFLASQRVKAATLEQVNILQQPYTTSYPALGRLSQNPDINSVWRNLVINCGSFLTRDRSIQQLMGNTLTANNPGVIDPDSGRLQPQVLRAMLPAGFDPIPFEKIGPHKVENRRGEKNGLLE